MTSDDRAPEKEPQTGAPAGQEEPAAAPSGDETREPSSAESTAAGAGDLPAELPEEAAGLPPAHPTRRGMFGVSDTGDTSGYGRLVVRDTNPIRHGSTPRPWGDEFDAVGDALATALPSFGEAVEKVVVDRGELTFFVRRE